MEEDNKTKTFDKILDLLNYIGTIGAVIMAIAYIIAVCVLIKGFKVEALLSTTVFAVVNAGTGFCILQFLKIQGQSLAEMIPENKKVISEYHNTKTKDKKTHSMKFYWLTSVVKDIFTKCLTLAATSIGIIYIVIQGNNDYSLLGLAVVNLLMFVCFGLLGLNKSYKYVNQTYIPYIKEQMKASTVEPEKEKDECLNLETKNGETCKSKSAKTKRTSKHLKVESKSSTK